MVFRPGRRFHFVKLVTRGFFPSSPPTGIGGRPTRHNASAAEANGPRSFGPPSGSLAVRATPFFNSVLSHTRKGVPTLTREPDPLLNIYHIPASAPMMP